MDEQEPTRTQRVVEPLTLGSDDQPATLAFAALLKRFRAKARLSQRALADRALVSVQAISALERGYRKAPYRDTIDRLAEALALPQVERASFEDAARRARGAHLAEHDVAQSHNLPRQITTFLGRDDVVVEVASLVAAGPLVSLVATGGAGKTRAAIEVAKHLVYQFHDGVCFVELAPLKDPHLMANALAGALRVQESSRLPLLETLLAYLQRKRLLIIFDNCEHVMAQARTMVGSLLRECPSVAIMVTSREALNIAGERVYRLPPLAVPQQRTTSAEHAMTYEAVALFADRARAADSRFAVNAENVMDIIDICRRLDGLPLAIELAAARSTVLSPKQIAEQLEHAFEVLKLSGNALPLRHQTMRAVIDWSYTLLSSQPRVLFDRLSTFASGFTQESATAVCTGGEIGKDDVLELLTSLVNRSLVMVDFSRGEARYHLLEATRQYGVERLTACGERERLAQRHARAFLVAGERLDHDWYDCRELLWFGRAQAELDNYRAALEWSLLQRRDVPTGRRLAAALARVWYSLSPVEGRRWTRLAIEAIDDETPVPVAGLLHLADAELSGALGEYKASLCAAKHALPLLKMGADRLQVARAKQAARSALSALYRGGDGQVLLDEALGIAREAGNQRLQALILGDLGTARSRRGDVSAARVFYDEALTIYLALGLERPAASIAGHLAEVEFAAGDGNAALHRALEALHGHEVTHNRRSVANDLCNMAAYLLALGRYEEADEYSSRALMAARYVGGTVLTAYALQHVAAVESLRSYANDPRPQQSHERAAMLLGFVDARLALLEAGREHTERQEYKRMLRALRDDLGDQKLRDLMARGATWSEDQAVAMAIDPTVLAPLE